MKFCFKASERKKQQRADMRKTDVFKVLLSFGRASNGQVLLDLAYQMFSAGARRLDVTALHLTAGMDVNPLRTEDFEKVSFAPVLHEADNLNMSIKTRYEVCEKVEDRITSVVNDEGFDFLLVGAGISMSNLSTDITAHTTWKKFRHLFLPKNSQGFIFYPGTLIKDKTRDFIEKSAAPVGVFVNRGFIRAEHILAVINSVKDLALLDYVRTLQKSTHGSVQLLNRASPVSDESESVTRRLSVYLDKAIETAIPFEKEITQGLLQESDLMLVTYSTWQILTEESKAALQDMPSTLIIEPGK
jgi:hypothetical protein